MNYEDMIVTDTAGIQVEHAYVTDREEWLIRVRYQDNILMVMSAEAAAKLGVDLTTAGSSAMGENTLLRYIRQHVKSETVERWMKNYGTWLKMQKSPSVAKQKNSGEKQNSSSKERLV